MISWQRDLEGASSGAEVVQLARGYIAAMTREAFAALPEGCRPSFISNAEDVRDWSARINEAYWALRRSGADTGAVQEIWGFFLRAATRLARLEEERAVS